MRVLTVNSGSSSLKLAVYRMSTQEELVLSARIERIGLKGSSLHLTDGSGKTLADEHPDLPGHDAALKKIFDWMGGHEEAREIDAVGHRLVHGGSDYSRPHLLTAELVSSLKELVPLAPDHLPHEIRAISAVSRFAPSLRQVACFDTSFHRTMPRIAQLFPLPRHVIDRGVIRYGFHGLSYEYIMGELRSIAGDEAAKGRVIVAHLGNGASMAAVREGKGIDTTMGFTPAGGLMMSSRSGDLDPGAILHLLQEVGCSVSGLNDIVNKESGLIGVSGISSDMKDLLGRQDQDRNASEAVQLFCYQARKHLGALVSVLGGLDTLVFTAGIGENAPEIRSRICHGMEWLGILIDEDKNVASEDVVSRENAAVTVRVMKTNEELMIARHTRDMLSQEGDMDSPKGKKEGSGH